MTEFTQHDQRPISLFGPILIIAAGLFFLFNRLNPPAHLYWLDMLRLWPLLLIFLGLNLLALHAPRPYASILSGAIAAVAVFVFGSVLLNGAIGTPLHYKYQQVPVNWQTAPMRFSAEDVSSADYNFIVGPPGADLFALEDSSELVAGNLTYQDSYLFETNVTGGKAHVSLAPQNHSEEWVFFPDFWRNYGEANRWQIGINGDVPASMHLEAVAGRSQLDLRDMLLDSLTLAVNAADVDLLLPDGNYDADLQTNAAISEVTLPDSGRQKMYVQVNAGVVTLHLPPGAALRVELDRALGSFSAYNAGLRRVNDQENVWQTPEYSESGSGTELTIAVPLGSVIID